MYWYIKYPLIAILVMGLLGLSGLVWRSCVKNSSETEEADVAEQVAKHLAKPSTPAEGQPSAAVVEPAQPQAPVVTPPVVVGVDERLNAARQQFDRGMLVAARQIARGVLKMEGVTEFSPVWLDAVKVINDVNKKLMNSSAPADEKKFYRVVKGDSLSVIASRHYTSIGALIRCNESLQRDDGKAPIIRPSQTLSYIQGTWSIRVSKQHFLLMLYLDNQLYRVWTVGIGRENRTPVGKFVIAGKLVDPAWTPPGKYIPAGDPENVLGTRWMKLTPIEGTDPSLEGYGIHGTTEPDTVGTSCSLGCVRLRNEEVEELYDFIPEPGGSCPPVKVTIEE